MQFTYLQDFSKTLVEDLELVQKALRETGAVVDSKLFPLIEEAEKGDYECRAELYEMFVYGLNDVLPNYAMAKRYAEHLQEDNLKGNNPIAIAEGMKATALMHYKFEKFELASEAFLECFIYSVRNLSPSSWDAQVIRVVADNIEDYQYIDEEYESE